jgi:hypothetical protein
LLSLILFNAIDNSFVIGLSVANTCSPSINFDCLLAHIFDCSWSMLTLFLPTGSGTRTASDLTCFALPLDLFSYKKNSRDKVWLTITISLCNACI